MSTVFPEAQPSRKERNLTDRKKQHSVSGEVDVAVSDDGREDDGDEGEMTKFDEVGCSVPTVACRETWNRRQTCKCPDDLSLRSQFEKKKDQQKRVEDLGEKGVESIGKMIIDMSMLC
eukprot:644760-Hanusia_phi.AAC.2